MKKKIVAMCATVALAAVAVGGTLAYFTDVESQKNTFTVGDVDIVLTETDIDGEEGARTSADQEFGVIMPGTKFVKDPIIENTGSQDAWVFLEMDLNKYVSLVNLMGVDAYINGIGGLNGEYPGFTAFVAALADDNALRAAVVDRWFTGIEHADWQVMNLDEIEAAVSGAANRENPSELCIILGYKEVLEGKDGEIVDSAAFMKTFTMPKTVTQSMFDGDDAYYIGEVSKSNFNTEKAPFRITFTAHAIQAAELNTLEAAYAALFA